MAMQAQIVFAMLLVFVPIAVDVAVDLARRTRRYRTNDLLANLTLSMLTLLGSALVAGGTLWIYQVVHRKVALLQLSPGAVSGWLLGFFLYDFCYYWSHRAHHVTSALWGVHVVHHSGEDMNFGLAVRQSALGGLTSWPFFLPMAVVGIPVEVYLGVSGVQLVYQYLIHNTFVPPLGWLEAVLVTPSQHRVHHARNQRYIDKNYGNVLVVWDRLFGSYQPELKAYPAVYGLRHSVRTWNPLTLHVQAFVETWRKAVACSAGRDKLRCFVEGPTFRPPSLPADYVGPCDDGASARFVKYDAPRPRRTIAHATAQLSVLTALIGSALWRLESLTRASVAVVLALSLLSAWSLGEALDGGGSRRGEAARLVVAGALAAVVVGLDGVGTTSLLALLLALVGGAGLFLHGSEGSAAPDVARDRAVAS